MSSNTPHLPGDDSEHGNIPPQESHAGGADPLASNPYSAQYRQGPPPDLDAGAPVLKSSDIKRMNRRALVFLAGIIVLLLVFAFWLIKSATGNHEAPKPKQETVVIPEAPRALPAAPPLPTTPTPPIPVAPMPPMPTAEKAPTAEQLQASHTSDLLERRMMSANQGGGAGAQQPAAPASPTAPINGLPDGAASAQPLTSPDTLLVRGTFIRCVLETRIITDIPGFTSCIVTEPVYSFNGHRLLLPKGSKVLGEYSTGPIGNRVAVVWDRIVTPNGIDVNMKSPGVDDLGGSGNPGFVNSHWPSRIGSALLISMLSDAFSYEAAEHGPKTTTVTSGVAVETPFQSNTAQTLQSLASQAVRQSANRPVTVTINQGTVVDVYVAKDVDFSGVVARF